MSQAIGAGEEIAKSLAHSQGHPAATLMLGSVVKHVAALAERFQVPRPVVARIVVEVSGRQHDPGGPVDTIGCRRRG